MHQPGPAGAGHEPLEPAPATARSVLPPPLGDRPLAAPGAGPDADAIRAIEILSHELRSPITTIHLGTKVLLESGRRISGPVRTEVVEAVEEEVERLYRLVEDLLAVARHDGGGSSLPGRPLLLQHWLPGVIAAEVHAAPALRVRASIPAIAPPVLADDEALVQVIRNLLANVVRYAPDGMPAEVVVWMPQGDMLRLEVLDRGPGIDEDDAERVFELFFRTPQATALGSAAGLGLTAARRLMTAMGGTIEALPRVGGGTRMVIGLPVAVDEGEDDEAGSEGGVRG